MVNVSMRIVLIGMMVILAVASCTIIGVLISRAGVASANEAATILRRETVHRKQLEISGHFTEPQSIINSLQAASKVPNTFNISDAEMFHPWLCSMMRLNDGRFTYVGTELGTLSAAEPTDDEERCLLTIVDARNQSRRRAEYSFTSYGTPFLTKPAWADGPGTVTRYDPRQRPWYNASKDEMSWSEIYLNWGNLNAVSTVGAPMWDAVTGRKVGVFATDFLTEHLVRYLSNQTAVKTGKMVLVETATRNVIGMNWNESSVVFDDVTDCGDFKNESCDDPRLANLGDLKKEPLMIQTRESLGIDWLYECSDFESIRISGGSTGDTVDVECEAVFGEGRDRVFVDVITISDRFGLNLRLIIMVPESDFLGEVWSRSDLAAIIASATVAGLIAIFVVVVYGVLKPLKRVEERLYSAAMLNDYDSTTDAPSFFTEIAKIQVAYNKMSAQLASVRSFIPQSLLQNNNEFYGKGDHFNEMDSTSEISKNSHGTLMEWNPMASAPQTGSGSEGGSSTMGQTGAIVVHDVGMESTGEVGNLMLNVDRVNAQVNIFRPAIATMLVVQLAPRGNASNLDVFGAECKTFMDGTIPHVLRFRGVIELQRPDRIVATFDRGLHAERAANCAQKIAKVLRRNDLLGVCVLHTGTFISGACGSQGRNAFVMADSFFDLGGKIAELSHRSLHSYVVVTDSVAKVLPVTMLCVPIDSVVLGSTLSESGRKASRETVLLYEVHKRTMALENESTVFKEVFTMLLSGQFRDVEFKVTGTRLPHLEEQLRRLTKIAKALSKETKPYGRQYLGWGLKLVDEDHDNWNGRSSITSAVANNDLSLHGSSTEDEDDNENATSTGVQRSQIRKAIEDAAPAAPVFHEEDDGETSGGLFAMAHAPSESPSVGSGSGNKPTGTVLAPLHTSGSAAPQYRGLTSSQNKQFEQEANLLLDEAEAPTRFVDIKNNTWLRAPGTSTIGTGAFSKVYLGMNPSGDIVALKCINLEQQSSLSAEKFLETEVSVLVELHHPNLASFISLAVYKSMVIIVMEYVAGGTLATVIRTYRKLLPRAATRRFALDILNGLLHLHDQGVVHGDIKPENVLLGSDSVCKLTDFGSSVDRCIAEHALKPDVHSTNEEPELRGTAPYMAPEVARGNLPTAPSDIWSFGILLHELLTGELPWEHENKKGGAARNQFKLMQGLARPMNTDGALRPQLLQVDSDNPAEAALLKELLRSCLQEDPAARPTAKMLMTSAFFV